MMTSACVLVEYIRDGLLEQQHFGYLVHICKNKIVKTLGESNKQSFYLRSCAKPLQASLLIDYGLDKEFDMSLEEIAICCASHAGEKIHTKIVANLMKKFGIDISMLKCGKHAPISKTTQNELLLSGQKAGLLHNNCSGKHAMMLGLCKLKGWNLKNYDDINHPLQQAIKEKIYQLCEINKHYPITKDGCGVPIHSMPLENIVKGYLNLFFDPKYEKIKTAFLSQPYLIGGENRTDTKIIETGSGLIAKVGAGGLIVVLNTELKEGFIVKICDANMEAREIFAIDYINKLGWSKINIPHDIMTNHEEKIGKIISYI